MNYWNLIPWGISLISLLFVGLSFFQNMGKDRTASIKEDDSRFEGIKEGLLKANIKLDQVCTTTNETRSDIKSMNKDLISLDKRVSVVERDVETAFHQINELKGKIEQ